MKYEIHDMELLAIVSFLKEKDTELRGLANAFTINKLNEPDIFID